MGTEPNEETRGEENKNTGTPAAPDGNTGEQNGTPTPSDDKSTELIDKATEAAERMERANKKKEELLQREEALRVKETLGGKGEASAPPKEDTPEEYARKVMSGEISGTRD